MNTKKKYVLTAEQDRYIQRKVVQVLMNSRCTRWIDGQAVREVDREAGAASRRCLGAGHYSNGIWVGSVFETYAQVRARRRKVISSVHWQHVGNQDGYDFRVLRVDGRWFIRAGCRTFTLREYYKHIDRMLPTCRYWASWATRRERMLDKCMQHCADVEYRIQAELLLSKQSKKK